MYNLVLRLERLELVAATMEMLQAETDLTRLAELLQADVLANWPTPMYDENARGHFLNAMRGNPRAFGWTVWYILLLEASGGKMLIGATGAIGPPDENGSIEIGYSILEQFFGHGYATEALRGFLDWAWQHSELQRVVADTFPDLKVSIRMLEKCGFVRAGEGSELGAIRFELRRH